MGVRVVTDGSAVLPWEWTQRYPLDIVPVHLAWASGELSDGAMSYAELAARIAGGERPPKTAAPSPGVYQEVFEHLLVDADALLVVCPASELSTTYSSAIFAARSAGEDRVHVLDARTAAAGQGIVAAEAARAAGEGADLEGTTQRALEVAGDVQIWATLSQLDSLRRSGRLPAIAAIGAGALGLQPIVRYAGGSPAPVGVTRNARRGADRILRAWQRSFVPDGALVLIVFHSDRADDAEHLQRRVLDQVPTAETHIVEVSASLASHTGPGLLGLGWFWDRSC